MRRDYGAERSNIRTDLPLVDAVDAYAEATGFEPCQVEQALSVQLQKLAEVERLKDALRHLR
jgi:hypothetical protein